METSELSKEELNYIQACAFLYGELKYRYEINHLHCDLQNSEPECRHLSSLCLTKLLQLHDKSIFDKEKALVILNSQPDHLPSLYLIAKLQEDAGNYSECFENYLKLDTYAPALIRIGAMLATKKVPEVYSNGFEEDCKNAYELGEKALAMGFLHANNYLGTLYDNKIGIAKHFSDEEKSIEATKRYRLAADKGCSWAVLNLGIDYIAKNLPGEFYNQEQRYEIATKYFEEAAEKEDPEALYRLGRMYKYGYGSAKSWSGGRKLREYYGLMLKAKEGNARNFQPSDLSEDGVRVLRGEGIFAQEILDTLFYNMFDNDGETIKLIEGENFLLYSEKGFNLDLIGALCQGKLKQLQTFGEKIVYTKYEDYVDDFSITLPETYKNKKLKKADVELDMMEVLGSSNINTKISCTVIISNLKNK